MRARNEVEQHRLAEAVLCAVALCAARVVHRRHVRCGHRECDARRQRREEGAAVVESAGVRGCDDVVEYLA